MKKLFTLLFSLGTFSALAQSTGIQWQKTLGGTFADMGYSIQQTADGGYIFAGTTNSANGDVTFNHGEADFWVIKMDAAGTIQWQKTYGGTGFDGAAMVQQTADGGYVVVGSTDSDNGDVSNKRGDKDYWVIKLDPMGNLQWQKCLGGRYDDLASSVRQTADGGYIISGYTASSNGDVSGFKGGNGDCWVVKLDNSGTMEWGKCLGGGNFDGGRDARQTRDGGYIVAAFTTSADGNVSGNHGSYDGWVVKLSSTGSVQWQRCLGGSSADDIYMIEQTTDDGYIVAGKTASTDGDVTFNHGGDDCWVVKLDVTGTLQWQKTLGGSAAESARAIQQTSDGGYIVAGYSSSVNGDVTGHHGNTDKNDFWLMKLSNTGSLQWQRSLGGTNEDAAYAIQQTTDGGYIVGGYTYSTDGDLSGNRTDADFWVLKLNSYPVSVSNTLQTESFSLFPNPVSKAFSLQSSSPIRAVVVLDISGRKIAEISGNASLEMMVSTTGWTAGTYFVRVETPAGTTTQQLVVAHQ